MPQDAENEQGERARAPRIWSGQMTPGKRLALVAGIALALAIPLMFMSQIVSERMSLYRETVRAIAATWGGPQLVAGPLLVIPLEISEKTAFTNMDGKTVENVRAVSRHIVLLPETLSVHADLQPEDRSKGIYHYTVYTSNITMTGVFRLDDIEERVDNVRAILWNRAFLAWGLSDLRGLEEVRCVASSDAEGAMSGSQQEDPLTPEAGSNLGFLSPGFNVPVRVPPDAKNFTVQLAMRINGSGGIKFAPVGETSEMEISSPWPHPSFVGEKLPAKRSVDEKGFTATWKIPHLARSYPQQFMTDGNGAPSVKAARIDQFAVGVDLFEPVTYYTLVERAVKYGLLFICLTFVGIIAFEASGSMRMHPIQYGLAGLAMVVFYLVLLALAEHTGFALAYVAACATVIAMMGAYVGHALRSVPRALGMMILLAALYLLLFAVLQLEEYALLVGTILVVGMLGTLMYVTRNLGTPAPPDGPGPGGEGKLSPRQPCCSPLHGLLQGVRKHEGDGAALPPTRDAQTENNAGKQ